MSLAINKSQKASDTQAVAKSIAEIKHSNRLYEKNQERQRIKNALELLGPHVVAVICHPETNIEALLLKGNRDLLSKITLSRVGGDSHRNDHRGSSSQNGTGSVNGWHYETRVYDHALVKAYKKQNPNHEVKVIHVDLNS